MKPKQVAARDPMAVQDAPVSCIRSGFSISACSKPAAIALVIIVQLSIVLLEILIRKCDGSVREEKKKSKKSRPRVQ